MIDSFLFQFGELNVILESDRFLAGSKPEGIGYYPQVSMTKNDKNKCIVPYDPVLYTLNLKNGIDK